MKVSLKFMLSSLAILLLQNNISAQFYQKKLSQFAFSSMLDLRNGSLLVTGHDSVTQDLRVVKLQADSGNIEWALNVVTPPGTSSYYYSNHILLETGHHTFIGTQNYMYVTMGGFLDYRVQIFEIDSTGQIYWQCYTDNMFETVISVFENHDSTFTVFGVLDVDGAHYGELVMAKINNLGIITDCKILPDAISCNQVIKNSNGNFIGIGKHLSIWNAMIFEFDSTGSVLFASRMDDPDFEFWEVTNASDGSYLVGAHNLFNQGHYYILKFDSSGNYVKCLNLEGSTYFGPSVPGFNYLSYYNPIAQSNAILKMDNDLNIVLSKVITDSLVEDEEMVFASENNFVYGIIATEIGENTSIFKCDTSLNYTCFNSNIVNVTDTVTVTLQPVNISFTQNNIQYYPAPVLNLNPIAVNWSDSCNAMTSGVNKIEKVDFSLYPNPSKSEINVRCANLISEISIFNSVGQLLQSHSLNSMQQTISIDQFSPGIYFIRVHNYQTILFMLPWFNYQQTDI